MGEKVKHEEGKDGGGVVLRQGRISIFFLKMFLGCLSVSLSL